MCARSTTSSSQYTPRRSPQGQFGRVDPLVTVIGRNGLLRRCYEIVPVIPRLAPVFNAWQSRQVLQKTIQRARAHTRWSKATRQERMGKQMIQLGANTHSFVALSDSSSLARAVTLYLQRAPGTYTMRVRSDWDRHLYLSRTTRRWSTIFGCRTPQHNTSKSRLHTTTHTHSPPLPHPPGVN